MKSQIKSIMNSKLMSILLVIMPFISLSCAGQVNRANDLKKGEQLTYFENGLIKEKFNYLNGEKEGIQLVYYPN